MKRKALGTVRRGKVKIYSPEQMRFLHVAHIDHTHFVRKGGKLKKVRHTY